MSYTSTLNNTHTPAHTIAPVSNEPTSLADKLAYAKGTGLTGSAIKKVANFIGMDDAALAIEPHAPVRPGMLSVDLELEAQARRQSSQRIAALEEAEQLRRLTLPDAEMKRKVLAIFTSRRVQNDLANPPKRFYDRGVSRRFLNYTRRNLGLIEEAERTRRMADKTGELLRRELAKEVTYKVLPGLQQPELRSTKHLINAPWPSEYTSGLSVFGGAAYDVTRNIAKRAGVSAYQLADFALRVGQFFGPKALHKGSELTEKAIATGHVVGEQALKTGQVLGHTALEKTQSLGHTAAEKTQSLGHSALEKTQSLGQQAVSGAYTLGQKASDAVVNTALGAQHLKDQALQSAKDLKDQTQSAVINAAYAVQDWAATPEPTLSWSQVSDLEEEERLSRNMHNFNPQRLMLAMRTSSLIRDHSSLYPMGRPAYGMRVLEEMERFERRSNQSAPRANARRVAAIISNHRQNMSTAAQSRVPAVILTEAVKSAPVWAAGLLITAVPSRKLLPEVQSALPQLDNSRSLNQLSTPIVSATPIANAIPATSAAPQSFSEQSPFVSQAALDAFSKAFHHQTPIAVYRPAM